MYNYCTLFDSNYLHKGLALYESLCNVCSEFHLYVVAFDDNCYNTLRDFKLKRMTVVSLSEFETEELLAVKLTRNRAEYCWTCGPSVIYHFITNYQLDHCTYLDSDMLFFTSPDPIYEEIGNNSIAITEHFTEEVDRLGGKFCVQFVYFRNDKDGLKALLWWKDKCIDWCYARFEDGKYGDQKYLDYFPENFDHVCILKNRGAGVAPWNESQYDFSEFGKIKYNDEIINIVFFHYHGTRIELLNNNLILRTLTYDLSNNLKTNIYYTYLSILKHVYSHYLNSIVINVIIEDRSWKEQLYSRIKKLLRHNKVVQYFYYKILGVKYNGYEGT